MILVMGERMTTLKMRGEVQVSVWSAQREEYVPSIFLLESYLSISVEITQTTAPVLKEAPGSRGGVYLCNSLQTPWQLNRY